MSKKIRLVVSGSCGRMGRLVIGSIASRDDCELVGALEHSGSEFLGRDAGEVCGIGVTGVTITDSFDFKNSDGVIDFSTPSSSVEVCGLASSSDNFCIIGTTGLSESDESSILESSKKVAIVRSGNFSLGVNLLSVLVERASRSLDYDIEIVETHHRDKVDAPSGTALLLGESASRGRDVSLSDVSVRDGHIGGRTPGKIGFGSLRGGGVTGDHSVLFLGDREVIELSHRSLDRRLFSDGAVRAAIWASSRPAGCYDMLDVLGIGDMK